MPRRYIKKWSSSSCDPTPPQLDLLTRLAFSIDGIYLASGNANGVLLIALAASGQRLYTVRARSGVLSLVWAPLQPYELWVGYADGRLAKLKVLSDKISITVFFVHQYPLEQIAFDRAGEWLATGGRTELKIWQITRLPPQGSLLVYRASLYAPPSSRQEPVAVSSLRWLTSHDLNEHDRLLATYIHHGIACWSRDDSGDDLFRMVWTLPMRSLIGHADVSSDELRIAISNLDNGVDIYELSSGILQHSIKLEMGGSNNVLPVMFLHQGHVILTASAVGNVRLWNAETGKPLHSLQNSEGRVIRAITAHYDGTHRVGWIATGTGDASAARTTVYETVEIARDQGLMENTIRRPRVEAMELAGGIICWSVLIGCIIRVIITWSGWSSTSIIS